MKTKLKVNNSGKVHCKADWEWIKSKESKWNDLDLWVILGGKGLLSTNKGNFKLSAGDCFLLPDDIVFHGATDTKAPISVIYCHFNYCDPKGKIIFPSIGDIPKLYRKMKDFAFFTELLERLLKARHEKRMAEAGHWLASAILEMTRQDRSDAAGEENDEPNISIRIQELCRKIQEHPEQRFSLKEEAKKHYYSTDHFSRLFKEQAKLSFRDYAFQSRMNAAKSLLEATSHSIGRIAEILGYNDVYLFSRQFKNECGISPSEYRKK
jgi:AraC-like DNA-binding protein